MELILQQRKLSDNENHLHKPINQFRLIQRFRTVWPKVQDIFDDEDIVSRFIFHSRLVRKQILPCPPGLKVEIKGPYDMAISERLERFLNEQGFRFFRSRNR